MDVKSFAAGLSAGIGLIILRRIIEKRSKPKAEIESNIENNGKNKIDYLFFSPEQSVWNDCSVDSNVQCDNLSCPFCNYNKLMELIGSAKTHIDICMYIITLDDLSQLLVKLFKQGIFVRIITDKQMNAEVSKSKICFFLKEHIPVKIIKTTDMMHNKFVIIDQKLLITGSLNWTRQGVTRNFENAVVIHNHEIVSKFIEYFQELWIICTCS